MRRVSARGFHHCASVASRWWRSKRAGLARWSAHTTLLVLGARLCHHRAITAARPVSAHLQPPPSTFGLTHVGRRLSGSPKPPRHHTRVTFNFSHHHRSSSSPLPHRPPRIILLLGPGCCVHDALGRSGREKARSVISRLVPSPISALLTRRLNWTSGVLTGIRSAAATRTLSSWHQSITVSRRPSSGGFPANILLSGFLGNPPPPLVRGCPLRFSLPPATTPSAPTNTVTASPTANIRRRL